MPVSASELQRCRYEVEARPVASSTTVDYWAAKLAAHSTASNNVRSTWPGAAPVRLAQHLGKATAVREERDALGVRYYDCRLVHAQPQDVNADRTNASASSACTRLDTLFALVASVSPLPAP